MSDYPTWHNYKKPAKHIVKNELDDITYRVTQENATEPPGSSVLITNDEDGIYVDILSGQPLFSSRDKYDAGCGWPSFTKTIAPTVVTEHQDLTLHLPRTEIRATISDNHLGHVFTDGPRESGGLRYCMNGVALRFVPKDKMREEGYEEFISEV